MTSRCAESQYYGFNDGDWTYDQDLCAARANARPGIRPGGRNRVQEPPAQFEYTITNALEVPVLFLAGDSIDSPGRIVKGGQITLRSPKFAHVTVAAGLPGDEIKILHFHSTGPAGGYPPGQYRLDNSSGFVPDPAAGPRHPEQPRP